MKNYFKEIYEIRHFWLHLTRSDLNSKWGKSYFGIFWSILQPLGTSIILAFVYGKLFSVDFLTYAPYILSGEIVWEFILASTSSGSLSFVQADAYIKQGNRPISIYSLRAVNTNLCSLILGSTIFFSWGLIIGFQKIGFHTLAAFAIFPILWAIFWPITTALSYLGAIYRDIPYILGLVMSVVWFISPIYFEVKLFRKVGLDALVDWNPIYHILEIIRAPIIRGEWPTLVNFLYPLSIGLLFLIICLIISKKMNKRIIFFL